MGKVQSKATNYTDYQNLNVKKIGTFSMLACGLSWALYGGFRYAWPQASTVSAVKMMVVYMFGPASAVLICERLFKEPNQQAQKEGQGLRQSLGMYFNFNKYWLLPFFVPLAATVANVALGPLMFPNLVKFTPNMEAYFERLRDHVSPETLAQIQHQLHSTIIHPVLLNIINGTIAGFTINAVVALGEELGWRGFLLRELAKKNKDPQKNNRIIEKSHFWSSSFFTGFLWGVWHFPLIWGGFLNYPDHPKIGSFVFIPWCMLCAPWFTYLNNKTKGSVFASAAMHGCMNGFGGIPFLVLTGSDSLQVGPVGATGFVTLAAADLLLYLLQSEKDEEENREN